MILRRSGALSAMLVGMVVFATLSPSATISATKIEDSRWASVLQIPPPVRQETIPIQQSNLYLTGFHVDPSRPAVQGAAHYFCQQLTAEFAQCPIYGNNSHNARLIGVEYIISSRLFHSLAADEQQLWHPHAYEVRSGLLIAPGLSQEAEHKLMEHLASTYGKTWYLWEGKEQSLPTGRAPDLPVGMASMMRSPTRDGQLKPALVEERDRRFNVAVSELRQQRVDITPTDTPSQKERCRARADMPVQLSEPLLPSVQPAPAQLGLPTLLTPQQAKPGSAPPMRSRPAEPPSLSTRPNVNLSTLAVPKQEPAADKQSEQ